MLNSSFKAPLFLIGTLFVLTTLIYRSQLNLSRPSTELRELVERARPP
jgi:hypothetical protein